jgi:hypothetical protein
MAHATTIRYSAYFLHLHVGIRFYHCLIVFT